MTSLLAIIFSILSFGAVGDGKTDNTQAITQAITQCAQQGGGTVVFPAGTYVTGTLHLQSGVTLRLEEEAVLMGSADLQRYQSLRTTLDLSRYESGRGTVNYNSATDPEWSRALIFCVGIDHAGIEGPGTIDVADVRNPKGEEGMRGPHTVLMAGCRDMRFEGFTVRRSANYAFLAYQIDRTTFRGLTITGGWDGIHIRGGKHITLDRCIMHTGDDAIAGGYWERATISHCTLNSSCNGIRMIMPSTRVEVSDCDIYGPGQHPHITSGKTSSDAAINIEPGAWGEAPGRLDKIVIRRVRATQVLTPLSVTLGEDNSCGSILVEDLVARDITRMALSVKSWGTAMTDRVTIRRADLQFRGIDDPNLPQWFKERPFSEWPVFPCYGMYFRNVGKLKIKDTHTSFTGKDYRKAIILDHVGKDTYKEM